MLRKCIFPPETEQTKNVFSEVKFSFSGCKEKTDLIISNKPNQESNKKNLF